MSPPHIEQKLIGATDMRLARLVHVVHGALTHHSLDMGHVLLYRLTTSLFLVLG